MSTKMRMSGLQQMHLLMQKIPKDLHQFSYSVNNCEFDCLFDVSGNPYELSLTSVGKNPLHIVFVVSKHYMVNTTMDQTLYIRLATILRTHGNSGAKLYPSVFLGELNKHILKIKHLQIPKPNTRERSDINGNSSGESFWHWRYYDPNGNRGPSNENRAKTLKIMGPRAESHSINKRCSSVWRK